MKICLQLLCGALVLASSPAFADACSGIEADVAEKASAYIKNGDTIQEYCQPCGDKKAKKTVVSSLEVKIAVHRGTKNSSIMVNGTALDLAYAYVLDKKAWTNLGHLAKCDGFDAKSEPVKLPAKLVEK